MQTFAFETDIVSEFLRIPHFEQFKNKHVRIVIEAEEVPSNAKNSIVTLLNNAKVKPFQQINDPLAWQTALRDEWT